MTTTTEQPVDGEVELAADALPFLKITGTYAVAGYRYDSICLEMNLGPDDQLAEVSDADSTTTRSWFIDLVTMSIDALRRPPRPQAIVLTGTGAQAFLADRLAHADDCDGTCGQSGPETDAQRNARRQQFVDRVFGRSPGKEPAPAAAAAGAPAEQDGGA